MKISLQLEYSLKGSEYSTYLRQCTRCGGAHKVDKTRTHLNIIFYTHSVKIYIYMKIRVMERERERMAILTWLGAERRDRVNGM